METLVKYNNRKIYNSNISQYVDLNYIIDLVKLNQRFRVIEHNTKKDITNNVLKKCLIKLNLSNDILLDLIKR